MNKILLLILLFLPTTTWAQLNTDRSKKPRKVPSILTEFHVDKNPQPVKSFPPDKDLQVKALEERIKRMERQLEPKPTPNDGFIPLETFNSDHRYAIIRPDGSFHSPRFLDYDRRANTLYSVSGAAINQYGRESMWYRNQLERKLDADWDAWLLRKKEWLKLNKFPMLPFKK